MRWRLLLIEGDAAFNMAVDEALMVIGTPTVRFYRFRPSAVTIGRFQRVSDSVNLEALSELGIKFVRRPTGGGSVFHDELGEITYSVAGPRELFPVSIEGSLRWIAKGVIKALDELGVKAELSGINDVVVNGRKISGSAQARTKHNLMQHGTLMYATDLEKLSKVLRAPKEKLADKGVTSIYERVTTASLVLSRRISYEEALEAMIKGFSFLGELEEGELTDSELEVVRRLVSKYESREWNFRY